MAREPADLAEEFGVDRVVLGDDGMDAGESPSGLEPNYNVAPTDDVYAVLERLDKRTPDAAPSRQLRIARWGLVPSWAGDPKIGSRLINARAETLASKPAFRKAFAARRCLLPADGYYEWYADGEGLGGPKGRGVRKQPVFIRRSGGGILAMAGLYEFWRDPKAADAKWLWSVTVVTTQAGDDLGRIHDRVPMLIEPDGWDTWLDPRLDDPKLLAGLLTPAVPGRLAAYPVSTLVNDVRNNGPQLVRPLDG
jgi:putative SOS response-associated peptidase YedK